MHSSPILFVPRSEVITLSAAFIPDTHKRRDYLILWSLLEALRDISAKVSDPLLGEIRLKWWAESLLSPSLPNDRDPLLIELKRIILENGLELAEVESLIEAQAFWLGKGPRSLEETVAHIDQSEGQLVAFGTRLLGFNSPIDLHKAMRAYGLGYYSQKEDLESKIDIRIYQDEARAISKTLPYQLLPLIMPSLIKPSDRGILLRLKLLKIYMFGA